MYISLHNHTDYSNTRLIDSTNKIERLIDEAINLGLKGLAITDHDNLGGHLRALQYYDSIKDKNPDFKLILGNEIYITRNDLTSENHERGEKFHHLILLAKDKIGHDQIREISSIAYERSYMKNMIRVPTFISDLENVIGKNKGHVIICSACLGSYSGNLFKQNKFELIDDYFNTLQDICGQENLFLEMQPSNQKVQIAYNTFLYERYRSTYKFIITTDSHYYTKEYAKVHKTFLNSKDGDREVDEFYATAHLMGRKELLSYFSYLPLLFLEGCLKNTNDIGDNCFDYSLNHQQEVTKIEYSDNCTLDKFYREFLESEEYDIPDIKLVVEENNPANIHLLNLAAIGWKKLLLGTNYDKKIHIERLNLEMGQINKITHKLEKNMSDYFISMAKFIEIMWNEGDSLVGVGRGSAVSSLINYLIGITQINPLQQPYEMPFWRFMDDSRPELADIDIDTESSRRIKVFHAIQEYMKSIGGDLINICTYGTLGSRSAINTAGKGLDIDKDILSYMVSLIPNERGSDWTLQQCYEGDAEHKAIPKFKELVEQNRDLYNTACELNGLIVSLGCHASGVIALNSKVHKLNSLMKTSKGILVTAFDLHDSEIMGGLKYD